MNLYQNNRKKLMGLLTDGLILVVSSEEKQRNSDVDYRFRQDSDFLYLTNITSPGYALILDPKSKKSHLVIPDISQLHQIWVGKQLTTQDAKKMFGVDTVHYAADVAKLLPTLLKKYKKIHALPSGLKWLQSQKCRFTGKKDSDTLRVTLNEMRVRKSAAEIELLKIANRISNQAHIEAMTGIRTQMHEYQVQAILEKTFLDNGASHMAYPSIVATGKNAAILHYHDNNMPLESNDLLLIDAGCEWNGYAADITRTFPVSGKFTSEQRDIYQIVLDAQKECIALIRPGVAMLDLHNHACRSMTQGLMRLGILHDHDIDDIIKSEAHTIFFPHGIGHLLGLDVHDVGAKDPKAKPIKNKPKTLRASRTLEPGFVVTIEPGIYFIAAHFESKATRKKFAKFINWTRADSYRSVGGIRIEDDILVTAKGHENLTETPKEISDIENLMA